MIVGVEMPAWRFLRDTLADLWPAALRLQPPCCNAAILLRNHKRLVVTRDAGPRIRYFTVRGLPEAGLRVRVLVPLSHADRTPPVQGKRVL